MIGVAAAVVNESDGALRLARAVQGLMHHGHQAVIIHGEVEQRKRQPVTPVFAARSNEADEQLFAAPPAVPLSLISIRHENQYLASGLIRSGIPVFGLCASDGGICRVRRVPGIADQFTVEAAQIDSRWLQIICDHGGVPVVSNLVLSGWGEYCLIDSDQMAAACAYAWRANALVYVTAAEGVRDGDGAVMRWLNLRDLESVKTRCVISRDVLSKLNRCRQALQQGVQRVRILPMANLEAVESLFSSRTDYGTEVFMAADRSA